MYKNLIDEDGINKRIFMWECTKDDEGKIVIKNIIASGDPLRDSALKKEEIEALGISLEVQETLPKRPHPFFPKDKGKNLDTLIIYQATLTKEMEYSPSRGNPEYGREICIKDKIIATLFARHGQYIDILSPCMSKKQGISPKECRE